MALAITGAMGATATSVAIPSHNVGDLIIIFAYNSVSATLPSKPAASGTVPAWVDIDAPAGANTSAARTAFFVATATNHTSGAWANAATVTAFVISGGNRSTPIGGHVLTQGVASNAATAGALTQANTDGSSMLLYIFRHRTVTAYGSAPAGYTAVSGVTAVVTKNDTTSDGSVTYSLASSSSAGYVGAGIEILAPAKSSGFFALF